MHYTPSNLNIFNIVTLYGVCFWLRMATQMVNFVHGQAVLQEDALRSVLESEEARDRPVMVVSVVGTYRRGKSFLLNFFILFLRCITRGIHNWLDHRDQENLDGFTWRHDMDRVTSGISIWPEVFVVNEVAIVLLDTQGTFDKETDLKENAAIVAITSLLSSVQIVNISQRFESHDLTNLQFFTEYGNLIENNSSNNAVKVFQDLIFLIRDWGFQDKFNFGFDGGDRYLNDFISPSQKGRENTDFRSVKLMLNNCFNSVKCFLMPHPGDVVANDRNFRGRLPDIDENFVNYLRVLVESLFHSDNMTVKNVAGRQVTGKMLMNHVRVYVSILNSGSLPEPKTMFNILADEIARTVVKEARDLYLRLMMEENEIDEDALRRLHDRCQTEALLQFDEAHKLGAPNHVHTFKCMLIEQINEEYQRIVTHAENKRNLQELQEKWEEQSQQNLILQEQISNLQSFIDSQNDKIKEQNRHIEDLKITIQESENNAKENEKKLSTLQSQLVDVLEKHLGQQKKNTELIKKIEENAETVRRLQQQLEESKNNKGDLGGLFGMFCAVINGISAGVKAFKYMKSIF